MPTTLSQVQIINQALARIGVKPIESIETPDDIPSEQARVNWPLALGVVGRAAAWNCLLKPGVLVAEAQDPITPPGPTPVPTAWAPATHYAAGDYVSYGSPAYTYQALIANLSTASFVNDLTSGYWFQTDIFNPDPFGTSGSGALYPSGWAYKYPLPADCLLVVTLNDMLLAGYEEEFEIMGGDLYTNYSQAIIKYTWSNPDTTKYDTLFVECLVLKLAAMMATILRQDDAAISQAMEGIYLKKLSSARTKNAGERKPRRFNPVTNSRFIGSRYRSTNS